MKKVSYQDLKRNLSRCLDEVEGGEPILVTRHEKPVAVVSAALQEHLTVGAGFGRRNLAPLFSKASKGRYLEFLLDDRREDPEH